MILTMMVSEEPPDEAELFSGGGDLERSAGCTMVDIMIQPEQKIQEIYQGLLEHGYFPPVCRTGQIRVYSFRQEEYINPMLTFRQGGIYGGDILRIL